MNYSDKPEPSPNETSDVADNTNLEIDETDLDTVAEDFSKALREGRAPQIRDYLDRFPQHGSELQELLESIEMIEGLKQNVTEAQGSRHVEPNLQQLDDYKIIREIGRGGMGIVFEAIHGSLGRRVAVKVLASRLVGDAKHLARFRREARAAAKLRHPNIVPVFGAGNSDEHHYYVMDYIDGISLHQWLDTLDDRRVDAAATVDVSDDGTTSGIRTSPGSLDAAEFASSQMDPIDFGSRDYFRWVANVGATTASALQYAHSQGVLHRDIKPANLLIDRSGDIWVADFGLAKLAEQQTVTMTGDIVGTPQYMPPESFNGNYDAKSEVYGLGLTLYELLTLQPAIKGSGTAEIIRNASQGVSVSPAKIIPEVPHDLETIVLKSLAVDPRLRYVSAGELRDDLRRFLAERPISARRSSYVERLLLWSRREPAVASLAFATFVLLFALAAVSAVGYFRTKSALDEVSAANEVASNSLLERTLALKNADAQKERAERNLQVAVSAFDEIMENISQRGVESGAEFLGEVTDATSPNVTPEDAELLRSLLGFFDDLSQNNNDELLEDSALAARRAGDILVRLGKLQEAENSYNESLNRTKELSQREPQEVRHVIAQAETLNDLAVVAGLRGRIGVTYSTFERVEQLFQSSPDALKTPQGSFAYARAQRLYGSNASRTGLDDLLKSKPKPPGDRPGRRPVNAFLRLRTEDVLSTLDEAIEGLQSLLETNPDDERYKAELARTYRDKATVASQLRRKQDSESAVRRSIDLFDELLNANPTLDAIRYELALTLSSSEALSFNQILRANRAYELSNELLRRSPDQPRYRALRAHTLEALAAQQHRTGRLELAERNLSEASRIYDSLIAESPELVVYQRRRSQTLESRADLQIRRGNDDEAIELLERAVRRLSPSLRRQDVSPLVRMQIQRMNQKLIRVRTGKAEPRQERSSD